MPQPHPHPAHSHLSHRQLDEGGRHPEEAEKSSQLDSRCVRITTPPRKRDDLGLTLSAQHLGV